jgi:hypothetical protein
VLAERDRVPQRKALGPIEQRRRRAQEGARVGGDERDRELLVVGGKLLPRRRDVDGEHDHAARRGKDRPQHEEPEGEIEGGDGDRRHDGGTRHAAVL